MPRYTAIATNAQMSTGSTVMGSTMTSMRGPAHILNVSAWLAVSRGMGRSKCSSKVGSAQAVLHALPQG